MTAVQTLLEKHNKGNIRSLDFVYALEQEKQQILDAHRHGFSEGVVLGSSKLVYKAKTAEEYYKEKNENLK